MLKAVSDPPARLVRDIFFIALALNFAWEMTQMHFYSGLPGTTVAMLAACGSAAAGDALYTVLVYWAGKKLTGNGRWVWSLSRSNISTVLASGFASAVILERVALALGFWRYSGRMWAIPGLDVGVLPVIQLMVLPLAVFRLVRRRNFLVPPG